MKQGWLLVLLTGLAGASLAAEDEPLIPPRDWSDYRVIVERNIFEPRRRPMRAGGQADETDATEPSATQPTPATQPTLMPEIDPGQHILLVGIGIIGDRPHAILEDRQTGQVSVAQVGQMIAGRQIAAIDLDAIELHQDDQPPRRIQPGHTLSGAAPASLAPLAQERGPDAPASDAPPAAAQAQGDSPAASGEQSSILEQLRRRRLQELRP